MAKKRQPVVSR